MSQNLPILYLNVLSGLKSEQAKTAFLWATDKVHGDRHCYAAERFAREVDHLSKTLWTLISLGRHRCHRLAIAKVIDLHIFMLRRHAHLRFPGCNEAWI